MQHGRRGFALSILVFAGSLLTVLYALYYMQQISLSIGMGTGILLVRNVYNATLNTTASATLTQLASNIVALKIALDLSYMAFILSIVMLTLSSMMLFQNRSGRAASGILLASAITYAATTALMQANFTFYGTTAFALSYLGAAIVMGSTAYGFAAGEARRHQAITRNVSMDPQKPYTNLVTLSESLISRFGGSLNVLDMHFDSTGMRNLSILLHGNEPNFKSVNVLMGKERASSRFVKEYRDFKEELANSGIAFDVRVMNDEDFAQQHERLLYDDSYAYKIPPLNIINKKSEHIVGIKRREAAERFGYMWGRATKLENAEQPSRV